MGQEQAGDSGAAVQSVGARKRQRAWFLVRAATAAVIAATACARYAMPGFGPMGENSPPRERPADVSVVRAVDLGPLRESPFIVARDGGVSSEFEGRSVWLFGDTLFRRRDAGELAGVSNSWAWTRDFDARDGIDFTFPTTAEGDPAPLLAETSAERAFNRAHAPDGCREKPCGARWALWPMGLVSDPDRARELVFYAKIYAEPGDLNFRWVGNAIAVWNDVDRAPTRIEASSRMMFAEPAQGYGNTSVVVGDDLYVYGCGSGEGLKKPCRVARVPLADALDVTKWRYFTGNGAWSTAAEDARAVLDANDVLSVAYNPYLSEYLAVYVPPLTNRVMMRTARRPEGPWSAPVEAFTTRTPARFWVYDAQAHPELERNGGRTQYVTYSMTTDDTKGEMRLVEVELAGYERMRLAAREPLEPRQPGARLR